MVDLYELPREILKTKQVWNEWMWSVSTGKKTYPDPGNMIYQDLARHTSHHFRAIWRARNIYQRGVQTSPATCELARASEINAQKYGGEGKLEDSRPEMQTDSVRRCRHLNKSGIREWKHGQGQAKEWQRCHFVSVWTLRHHFQAPAIANALQRLGANNNSLVQWA